MDTKYHIILTSLNNCLRRISKETIQNGYKDELMIPHEPLPLPKDLFISSILQGTSLHSSQMSPMNIDDSNTPIFQSSMEVILSGSEEQHNEIQEDLYIVHQKHEEDESYHEKQQNIKHHNKEKSVSLHIDFANFYPERIAPPIQKDKVLPIEPNQKKKMEQRISRSRSFSEEKNQIADENYRKKQSEKKRKDAQRQNRERKKQISWRLY